MRSQSQSESVRRSCEKNFGFRETDFCTQEFEIPRSGGKIEV